MRIACGIPCNMLSHLANPDIFPFILHLQIGMAQYRCFYFFRFRRRYFCSALQISRHFPEYPGVSLRCPSDHDSVAAGFLHHTPGRFSVNNIPISDHRNTNRFFHRLDHRPIRLARVKLLPCPAMYGHSRRSGSLRGFCNLHRISGIRKL